MKNNKVVGYTAGVYDMFHVGHLNLIKRAKEQCDYLIVGINSDNATYKYKKKFPIVNENERLEVVSAIKYVDEAVLVNDTDKILAFEKFKYDKIFVGDDHKGESSWVDIERDLKEKGSEVIYFTYTKNTSSTKLREALDVITSENGLSS